MSARYSASLAAMFISAFLAVAVLVPTQTAAAFHPKIITFDAPGAGTGVFQGTGCSFAIDCTVLINEEGTITGYYLDANNVYHGFVRSPEGKITTFDAPGADTTPGSFNGTLPSAINDAGAITGVYADVSGGAHGFLRSPEGVFTSFDVPGSPIGSTLPRDLNLEGAIVGFALDQNNSARPFLRRPDGTFATWNVPGECDASGSAGCFGAGAFTINLFGTISSGYEDNSGNFVSHGVLRRADGKLTTFNAPGAGTGAYQGTGCPGCARSINLFGAVAGFYIDQNNVVHGYLRSPAGKFTPFDIPGAGPQGINCYSDCSLGLNDFGAITGFYLDANNVYHGFVRSPEGKITTFDAPGADTTPGDFNGTYPNSINDAGVITGTYQDANSTFHAFVLFP
jgi:hypothetical protein